MDPRQTKQQQLLQETLNELDKRRKVGVGSRELGNMRHLGALSP